MLKRAVLLTLLGVISATEFEAYDCREPKNAVFINNRECRKNKGHTNEEKILIVQEQVANMTAYRCTVTETVEAGYCGHASVDKHTDQSYYNKPIRMTIQNCRSIVETGQIEWRGTRHKVELDAVSYISFHTHGSVKYSTTNIECQGEPMRLESGDVVANMMKRVSLQVKVHRETVTTTKGRVTARDGQFIGFEAQGAGKAGMATYVWTPSLNQCTKVAAGEYTVQSVDGRTWFNSQHQIQIVAGESRYDEGCKTDLVSTDFEDLYIVKGTNAKRFNELNSNSVSLNAQYQAQINYVRGEARRALNREFTTKNNQLCHFIEDNNIHSNQKADGNVFIRNLGDVTAKFECEKVIVEADNNTKECYKQVAIIDSNQDRRFMDPDTRILLEKGDKTTCTVVDVPAIQATDGRILMYSPEEREVRVDALTESESVDIETKQYGIYPEDVVNAYLNSAFRKTYEEKWDEFTEGEEAGKTLVQSAASEAIRRYRESLSFPGILFGVDWEKIGNRCSIIVVGLVIIYTFKIAVGWSARACIVYGGGRTAGESILIALCTNMHLLNEEQKKRMAEKDEDKGEA